MENNTFDHFASIALKAIIEKEGAANPKLVAQKAIDIANEIVVGGNKKKQKIKSEISGYVGLEKKLKSLEEEHKDLKDAYKEYQSAVALRQENYKKLEREHEQLKEAYKDLKESHKYK